MFHYAEIDAHQEAWYNAIAAAEDAGETPPTFEEYMAQYNARPAQGGMVESDIPDVIDW